MGIRGLTKFVERTYKWEYQIINGKLIIDGYSMCHNLYSFDWGHGGQFPEFRQRLTHFFNSLKRSGIIPTVVMDGIDFSERKNITIMRRRNERVNLIHEQQTKKRIGDTIHPGYLPSLAFNVFIAVMIDLKIEYIVADDEGDDCMYRLANAHSCFVLSSDSDFFMYKLKRGYIPLSHFFWEASPIYAKVYHYGAFCKQNKFKDDRLRLVIPVIAGNDFIADMNNIMSHIADIGSGIECAIKCLQRYETLEQFTSKLESQCDNDEQKLLKSNFLEVQRIYDSSEVTTLEEIKGSTVLHDFNSKPILDWLLKQFRVSSLSPSILEMLVVRKNILNVFVDDTASDSATAISLPIRKCLYGLTGSDLITEYYREGLGIAERKIRSIKSLKGSPLPNLTDIPTLSKEDRENLLYSILGCDFIKGLDCQWKLVMAATVFWAKETNASAQIVKALILSFVVCSSCTEELLKLRDKSVEFKNSPLWTTVLHSFAQWQSTYTDSLSLNELLMLPLKAASPADLYDGKLAMFFVLSDSVDQLLSMPPDDQQLFGTLLNTVVSQSQQKDVQRHREQKVDFRCQDNRDQRYSRRRERETYDQPPSGQQDHARGQRGTPSRRPNEFGRKMYDKRPRNFSRQATQQGDYMGRRNQGSSTTSSYGSNQAWRSSSHDQGGHHDLQSHCRDHRGRRPNESRREVYDGRREGPRRQAEQTTLGGQQGGYRGRQSQGIRSGTASVYGQGRSFRPEVHHQ